MKRKHLMSASVKKGMPAGSMVHVGDVHQAHTQINVIDYTGENLHRCQVKTIEELARYKNNGTTTLAIVEGIADTHIIRQLGPVFAIHDLVIEDILNTHQRPKFEDHKDYLFVVIKSLSVSADEFQVKVEQVSLLVMKGLVIVLKEKSDDILEPIYQRIETNIGRLRTTGADYLAYAILDMLVDNYFELMDRIDDEIARLEAVLLEAEPDRATLHAIQRLKWELIAIRKSVSPVRELVASLIRNDSDLFNEKIDIYLHDVSDHILRVTESLEIYREMTSGLLEIYLSISSNKMNEVMKVLTLFASIFIPLTFIVGIYGMNFKNMPELNWPWSYPLLWGVFIVLPIVLVGYFKRKKWL